MIRMSSDEKIKTDIVNHMKWDTRIDASDIKIEVDNGVVTIEGTVPSFRAKNAAYDAAWVVSGVVDVINNLDVKYAKDIDIPTDDEINANINSTIALDPDISTFDIDVETSNGWVTLEGNVDNYWQKTYAEELAYKTQGVLGVTNKLTIVPTDSYTDEYIAKEVTAAIDRNSNVFIDDIDIRVEDAKVYLSGTVPDYLAKFSAYDSARYTLGVLDVENNIIVE